MSRSRVSQRSKVRDAQLVEEIRANSHVGEYGPALRDLAQRFGLSTPAMLRRLSALEQQGALTRGVVGYILTAAEKERLARASVVYGDGSAIYKEQK